MRATSSNSCKHTHIYSHLSKRSNKSHLHFKPKAMGYFGAKEEDFHFKASTFLGWIHHLVGWNLFLDSFSFITSHGCSSLTIALSSKLCHKVCSFLSMEKNVIFYISTTFFEFLVCSPFEGVCKVLIFTHF